ncbi:MAG: FlgD immunoglobulin-like domain containing protein, partial [Ignavibacteriaceae bacterium]
LLQNYPNPFNPETVIGFQIPEANNVTIKIFNSIGQEVRTLLDMQYDEGIHSVIWDGKDNLGKSLSSGVYFYRLQAGTYNQVKKMSLLR